MSTNNDRKIMDQIHDYMRLHHYSIHTERSYCDWIKRFILFHRMISRNDFADGEAKIERFLTHLAVSEDVAPATQNQAMNALVFLYRKILEADLDQKIDAVRAKRRKSIPVVMTREEVRVVILLMKGTAQLIVKLLYGSGLRITEAIRLRVQDIDFDYRTVTIRSGKGDKDRVSTFPVAGEDEGTPLTN